MCKGETEHTNLQVVVAYFLIYVVWGSTYYVIGLALKELPPFLLGAFRFSIAGIVLLVLCYLRGEAVFKKTLIRKSAIAGIVLLFIDMAVVMVAQKYVSSSLVAIIASSTALWVMAFDAPMWKTNFGNPLSVTAIVIGFFGVLMLYIEQHTNEGENLRTSFGILLLVLGCISWALGTLYAKYYLSGEEGKGAFSGAAWQMIFASAMFCIAAVISGETKTIQLETVSAGSWISLLYLILFGSILAYSAYIWLLKIRSATEVGTHAYVNPFIAVFIGVTFGGENVTIIQMLGLALIIISIILIKWKQIKYK